jgi:hypothetical protein
MRPSSHPFPSTGLRIPFAALLATLLAAAILVSPAPAPAKGKPLDWKQAGAALLRIDDHPAAEWNLYQVNKKNDLLLLKIDTRFLLIDIPRHQIFEIDPSKIEHKGEILRWDPDDRPDKPLETADWLIKDVGDGYRYRARLVAENHVLDVQIPHPLDLRNIY